MTSIQTITIKGEEIVLVPKDKYEEMIEIIEDKIDLTEIVKQIESGAETFPFELVERLTDESENPIKVMREYRKITTTELAKQVGVSQSYISDIENGKKDGSISVVKKIAEALDVDIDMII